MAKVANKEHVQSYDELDFSDVFGGPPKRISMQDSVYSGSNDNNDDDDDNGGEEGGIRRSFWSEKPVFGDETGGRRRYPSDDFFGDIFRGDQASLSCSQSPRVVPLRDPFSSAPGSRIMSPTRPGVEPFGSPSKFSLPARLANTEFLAPQSPSHTRFNQNSQSHDHHVTDTHSGYRPSPLSHQKSIDGKKSNGSSKLNKRADESGSELADDIPQFHFSIYKWTSKGVPLIISLRKRSSTRSKGDSKVEKELSDIQVANSNQVEVPVSDSPAFNNKEVPFTSEVNDSDDIGVKKTKSSSTNPPIVDEQIHIDAVFSGFKDQKEMPLRSEKRLDAEVNRGPHRSSQSTRNFSMRSLSSFLQENKEDDTETTKKGEVQSRPKEKDKISSNDAVSSSKVNKTKQNKSSREEKDDIIRKREVPGKVKDFIKQFNQDYPSKSMKNVQGQSQSQRWKETPSFDADHGVKPASKTSHENIQASTVNWDKTWQEDAELIMDDEDSSIPGKQQSDININSSSGVSHTSTPTTNNAAEATRDPAPNIETTQKDDIRRTESIDMPQDENLPSASENKGETESYEIKVRKWSKGKEGNIRALLSTLQYILWPNSGWKPVPLVDIIEANAVKRSYQRALLCLHPDKLQQKGAAAHQKLIAENVFDILQEAWDQFNSLGDF